MNIPNTFTIKILQMIKTKFLVPLLLFVLQAGFSQNEKHINGTVLCNNVPVQGVDVVNTVSKKVTVTDSQGNFSIAAKAKDLLVFVSKLHDIKQLLLYQYLIDKNNLTISLSQKAVELQEVLITKTPSIEWKKDTKWESDQRNQVAVEKFDKTANVLGVNMGTIDKGMDFMKIGGMILHWFKKEKTPIEKIAPKPAFKSFATTTYPSDFFSKDLKLKPEEIPLFLEFCDADPKSKIIAENPDSLTLLDFLLTKNAEFKKL
jgi:hypothetical protein